MPIIKRDRITAAIERESRYGVALIVAPAGFGKSEAIRDALGDVAITVEMGNAVGIEGVSRAIVHAVLPNASRSLSDVLRRPLGDDRNGAILQWLARRLRSNDAPIVLDDVQRFNDDEPSRMFLANLIDATAPQQRWVIASRDTPSFPLGTWIANGWMTLPIGAADLAFSDDEARELAAAIVPHISQNELTTIIDQAEGWPIVLRLLMESRQRRSSQFEMIRSHDDLFQFLESELWLTLDQNDREILSAIAPIDRIDPDIFESAGVIGVQTRLNVLAKKSSLVRLAGDGTFRIHDLLRHYILDRHPRDERWYATLITILANSGENLEAVALAMQSRNARLIVHGLSMSGPQLISDGERAAVKRAIQALPSDSRESPIVRVNFGMLCAAEGDVLVGEDELRAVSLDDLPQSLTVSVSLRRARLALSRRNPQQALDDVVGLLYDSDSTVGAEAMVQTIVAYSMLGEPARARSLLPICLPLLDAVPMEDRANLYVSLARASFYLGDYVNAEQQALTALEFASRYEHEGVLRSCYSVLTATAQWMYSDSSVAAGYATRWLDLARRSGDRADYSRALITSIDLHAERADDASYEALFDDLRLLQIRGDPQYAVPLGWARSLYEVGAGRIREAAVTMSQLVIGENFPSLRRFAEALSGLLWAMAGEAEKASQLLGQAHVGSAITQYDESYEIIAAAYRSLGWWILGKSAMANRLQPVIPNFVAESVVVVLSVIRSLCMIPAATMTEQRFELLVGPLRALELEGHVRFLRAAYRTTSTGSLTPTELNVLRKVVFGKTNAEIASEMRRSPRTIEWHIGKICTKLGCASRVTAAQLAVERGWL